LGTRFEETGDSGRGVTDTPEVIQDEEQLPIPEKVDEPLSKSERVLIVEPDATSD
jgi:hypothetical protein